MPKKRQTTWYVEPVGAYTNSAIAATPDINEYLDGCEYVSCADGNRHSMWRCRSYEALNKILKSAKSVGLEFEVWNQAGNGQVRKWEFGPKSRRRRQVKRQEQPVLF